MTIQRALRILETEPLFPGGIRRDCWNDGLVIPDSDEMTMCPADILADDWKPMWHVGGRWRTQEEFHAWLESDEEPAAPSRKEGAGRG